MTRPGAPTATRRWLFWAVVLVVMITAVRPGIAQMFLVPRASVSHSGTLAIRGTELAEPVRRTVTSGGNLSVRSMNLDPACRGYATPIPDVIVSYSAPGSSLRFEARGLGRDTTLIIHTPDDRWLCDDDSGGDLDPLIVDPAPVAGQYDVWVGSYRIGEYHPTTLSIGP